MATVDELRALLSNFKGDLDVFFKFRLCTGNIGEIDFVYQDNYGFFGKSVPCVLLDAAPPEEGNPFVTIDEEDGPQRLKPSLGQMTKAHIVELAEYDGLSEDEIVEVVVGEGYIRLNWQSHDSVGTIYVDDDAITFSDDNSLLTQTASIPTLRLVASWGYDVMGNGEIKE